MVPCIRDDQTTGKDRMLYIALMCTDAPHDTYTYKNTVEDGDGQSSVCCAAEQAAKDLQQAHLELQQQHEQLQTKCREMEHELEAATRSDASL